MTFTGLYAILDVDAFAKHGFDVHARLEAIADALLSARPSALQLRAKHLGSRDTLDLLRRLRVRCIDVPLFANDRPDLAVLARCDGIHVGQEDLACVDVRAIVPASMMIGLSTHGPEQLAAALGEPGQRPSYVAFGPVYSTASKLNPDPTVGLAGLRASCATASAAGIPLVAIGGIDRSRVTEVRETGARWAAAISDLASSDLGEVAARARALHLALSA